MPESEDKYIYRLIEEGEHEQLDFKFEISSARKIAITLVSFANTKGGKILIGVKDNGRISGIHSDEEYYMIESAATNYCKPVVEFSSRIWSVEGKTVLEINIPEAIAKPHYAKDEQDKWIAYLRVKDQNFLANKILIDLWKQDKRKSGSLIKFSRQEGILLDYLRENRKSTLTSIIKDTGFNRKKLMELLVKLISFGVVEMEINEKGTFYYFEDDPGSLPFK